MRLSGCVLVDLFGVREVPVCLGCQAVAVRGITVFSGGLVVNGGIADTGDYCAFVNLGRFVMYVG